MKKQNQFVGLKYTLAACLGLAFLQPLYADSLDTTLPLPQMLPSPPQLHSPQQQPNEMQKPRPETHRKIDELLNLLQREGVVFKDIIELEPITNYASLKQALTDLGLEGVDDQTMLRDLHTTRKLWQAYAPLKALFKQQASSLSQRLQLLKLNPKVFSWYGHINAYHETFQKLRQGAGFEADYHFNFFLQMTATDSLLEAAVYPEDKNRHPDLKRSDLIILLASIKGYQHMAPRRHQLEDVQAIERDLYPSEGQSPRWREELNYKLYRLYQRFTDLDKGQKAELIGYLLHGGRHCNDAKWHAITAAYERFCPDDAALMKRGVAPSAALFSRINSKVSEIKAKNLSKYIYRFIDKLNLHHESCSFFNATWDHLARQLGLERIGSSHPQFSIVQAKEDFLRSYGEILDPKQIYEATRDLVGSDIEKNHLGVLSQLVSDKEELILGLLHFYGLLQK